MEGCDRARRGLATPYCEAHYGRVRKHGDPQAHVPLRPRRYESKQCFAPGCEKDRSKGKWCSSHEARLRRRGELEPEFIPQDKRNLPRGRDNVNWTEEPSYTAVHQRLRRWRGPASGYNCVTCDEQAEQWSYDHADPEQRIDEKINLPYSTDVDHYRAMCVRCHKNEDMDRLKRLLIATNGGATWNGSRWE